MSLEETEPYKISVNVDMVVLPVTVLDGKGHFVAGLKEKDFQAYENERLQKIEHFYEEDSPVTAVLVLDNSGSMRAKVAEVNEAALSFIKYSNPHDELGVVKFNEKATLGFPETQPFSRDPDQLRLALQRFPPRGKTALYDAIYLALTQLDKAAYSKKVILILSDGGDNSSRETFHDVYSLAQRSHVLIYTIGFYEETNQERDYKLLKRLALTTGGESFMPDTILKIEPLCRRIAREIRAQYTLIYLPSDLDRDGTYRRIQVKVILPGRPRFTVLTRAGYFAPGNLISEQSNTVSIIQ